MRVVHLATNQGKSTALNAGALVSNSEFIVGTDGDSLLDPMCIRWIVRRFQANERIGAITGNPRIRTRSTILGRIQVGEFSTILGLIRRRTTCSIGGRFCGTTGWRWGRLGSFDYLPRVESNSNRIARWLDALAWLRIERAPCDNTLARAELAVSSATSTSRMRPSAAERDVN